MRVLSSCLTILLLAACARQGAIPRLDLIRATSDPALQERCQAFFPPDRLQLVHAISFRLAQGEGGHALGVVVLDGASIDCVLTTMEGFTLFAARSAGKHDLHIDRAVPPFDRPGFAEGLMRDVRLLFRPPQGTTALGILPDGQRACRFHEQDRLVELVPQPDNGWLLREFTGQSVLKVDGCLLTTRDLEWRLTRSILAAPPLAESAGLAATLDLTASGPAGYTLNLRLLNAEPLPETSQP